MARSRDSVQAQKRIAELAQNLRQNNFLWAAECFETYLSGKVNSLDNAFGLVGAQGAPRKNSTLLRDVAVVRLRSQRKSWKEVESTLGLQDLRDAKRMVAALWKEPKTATDRTFRARAIAAFSEVVAVGVEKT